MSRQPTFSDDKEAVRAVGTALTRLSLMAVEEDRIMHQYGERYFSKPLDKIIDDFIFSSPNVPILLRRINVLIEQFEGFKKSIEKRKGDYYDTIVNRPKAERDKASSKRVHKEGATRQKI